MRIPSNIIIAESYTIGKEFVFESTYKEYQGYYYELNNKFFVGREFNPNAPLLLKLGSPEINPLKLNPATSTYANLTKVKISNNTINSFPQINSNSYDKGGEVFLKFYCKKNDVNPILIKQIDEKTYFNLENDPMYQTIYIGTFKDNIITPDEAYSKMIGLKEFIEG